MQRIGPGTRYDLPAIKCGPFGGQRICRRSSSTHPIRLISALDKRRTQRFKAWSPYDRCDRPFVQRPFSANRRDSTVFGKDIRIAVIRWTWFWAIAAIIPGYSEGFRSRCRIIVEETFKYIKCYRSVGSIWRHPRWFQSLWWSCVLFLHRAFKQTQYYLTENLLNNIF